MKLNYSISLIIRTTNYLNTFFKEGLDVFVFMTYKDIGRGIICNWSVLEILAKKEIYFLTAKKNTDEWKPEWYIAQLFQLKFQMDEDFTCQILYTVIAIYIFHSDHLSVSALLTLFKTKPKMRLDIHSFLFWRTQKMTWPVLDL